MADSGDPGTKGRKIRSIERVQGGALAVVLGCVAFGYNLYSDGQKSSNPSRRGHSMSRGDIQQYIDARIERSLARIESDQREMKTDIRALMVHLMGKR